MIVTWKSAKASAEKRWRPDLAGAQIVLNPQRLASQARLK
jgi:hypothetical protein